MESKFLARYLAGACSEEEKDQFQKWRDASKDNHESMDKYERIWKASAQKKEVLTPMFDAEQDWRTLRKRITSTSEIEPVHKYARNRFSSSRSFSGMNQLMRIAAVVMIAALVGVIAYQNLYSPAELKQTKPSLREIVTGKGQRTNITLSDGTRVKLNADSKIKLPDVFQSHQREVFLDGEAFFDVAKNPDKPFLIHSGEALIKILGTSLDIRSYPEDASVRVVVKEGRVSLSSGNGTSKKEAILTPGELGRMNAQNNEIITQKVEDLDLFLSWTEGYLKFKDTPMTEVAAQLERTYDINVNLSGAGVTRMRLTAVLKSRSIRNVLDVIAASLGITYEMDQHKVVFQIK